LQVEFACTMGQLVLPLALVVGVVLCEEERRKGRPTLCGPERIWVSIGVRASSSRCRHSCTTVSSLGRLVMDLA
jgi:hypothetical protein